MPIVEKIQLDTRQYMQSLSATERAAVRHAQKQENAYKNARRTMEQLEGDIRNVEAAIRASNSPESVKRYQKALDTLKGDYRQMEGEVKRYEDAVRGMGEETKKQSGSISQSFKNIGNSAKVFIAGAAAGAFYGLARAFKSVADEQLRFDQAMNESLAIQGNITAEQRDRMVQTARDVARELNMTTDEVAKGYFFLASAGLDAEQQIQNLGAVAQFAKAGMFDLATATDLATDAQSALGLTVDNAYKNQQNLVRVTDVLAKANSMANATIQQFSEALTNKGATALKNYSKEIDEGVAILAAYADQGVKGNIAGERLNILLKRLAESAQDNAAEFEALNVAVFDQEGRFRNVADIIADLEVALAGLSDKQRNATLGQLGFTAETQDAILPLIGLSDQLKIYEGNLRDAAGMTQEIADKQMQSLSQRFISLKRQLVDLFGASTLSLLEDFADALEPIAASLETFVRARSDRQLLDDIATQEGFDLPKIWTEGKKALEEQRKETERARNELRLLAEDARFFSEQIEKNPELSDAYERQLATTIKLLGNAKNTYAGNEKILQSLLEEQRKLGNTDAVVRLNIAIEENQRRLQDAEEAYRDAAQAADDFLNPLQAATPAETTRVELEAVSLQEYNDKVVEPLRKVYAEMVKVGEISPETARKAVGALTAMSTALGQKVNQQFSDAFIAIETAGSDAEKAVKDRVLGIITAYDAAMAELREKAMAGEITDQEFTAAANVETTEFRKELLLLEEQLRQTKALSPELKKAFQAAFRTLSAEAGKAGKESKGLTNRLHDVADAVSGILSLADSFGVLSQEMRAALRGSVDLLRNIENLKKARATDGAGFMDFAVPGIGIAASSIAILQGTLLPLFRNEGQEQMNAQELQELQFSIEENRRALERNTKALLEQAVVGQNLNQDIVDSLRAAFEQAVSTAGRYFLPDADARQSLNALQLALDAAGIDADLLGNFDEFVESGLSNSEALQRVLGLFSQGFGMDLGVTEGGLADLIQSIIDGFGAFSDTLQGAIEQFRLSIDLGGVSLQDALATFTARVRDLGTGIPEEILSQIEGLDLDTDAGREALDALIADLFAGRSDFMGNLSPDEFTDLLNFLEGLTRGGSGGTGEVVRSVAGVAGITEFQATDINMLLEAQLFEAGRQTDLLGDILNHMMGGRDSGLSRVPDPPPTMSASSINIGGVNVSAPMSDQQIMSITNQIANELKRLRQGGQFG